MNKNRSKASLKRQLQRHIKRLSNERDAMRDLLDDYEYIITDATQAIEDLESGCAE